MCGIAGGYNVDFNTIQKMAAHQGNRGPDHTGIYQEGSTVFAHNRLSIVDKSENGNQPMKCASGFIVYNGEVYNHREFEVIKAHVSDTDTERILNLLSLTGITVENINKLNGMFAFAIFDTKSKSITLVRDRFGIKPLYFTKQKDFFAFASTPAAVALTKRHWKISKKGVQEYLSLGATTLHSMFDGIDAVPPGHYLTFDIETSLVKITRWYFPKFVPNALASIQDKIITAIDRVKTTCDWPQVLLLSGGIDSSLVASRYPGQKAIHLKSPEENYARKVSDRFSIDMQITDPQNSEAEECLTDYITKSGDPTMAGLIPYLVCKDIKKMGYRVGITANGGDELFWGYDRMTDFAAQQEAIFRNFSFTDDVLRDLNYTTGTSQQREIWSYLTFDLNKTLDFASMCHSVEIRVPYLDHELVEAALSIDKQIHVGNFGPKTILKKMLVDLGFDFDFIHRPKIGFSLHHVPGDWHRLMDRAMSWYDRLTDYEKLPATATPRQQAYHQYAITGLFLWHRIFSNQLTL